MTPHRIIGSLSWINLEGTPVHIDWMAFPVGTSFFLPCCKCISLRNEIVNKAIVAGVEVRSKIIIENEVRGVRTWRLS
jgi:hypothetical protein|tara:strand:- start:19 stop:252 length:234 start_codon:yes stop_codon:yes gene_type:complete